MYNSLKGGSFYFCAVPSIDPAEVKILTLLTNQADCL